MKQQLRALFVSAVLGMSQTAWAVDVAGKVVYKLPSSGELVTRDVTLDVPPRGQGKIILKADGHSIESHAFNHKVVAGRTVFNVVFLDPPGAPAKTAAVFHGTYLRGSNGMIYSGDIYSRSYQVNEAGEAMLQEFESQLLDGGDDHHPGGPWTYNAGFMFTTLPHTP